MAEIESRDDGVIVPISTLDAAKGSAEEYAELTQLGHTPTRVDIYRVVSPARNAYGPVSANTGIGRGGGQQVYIINGALYVQKIGSYTFTH